jgi:hypothetical protein
MMSRFDFDKFEPFHEHLIEYNLLQVDRLDNNGSIGSHDTIPSQSPDINKYGSVESIIAENREQRKRNICEASVCFECIQELVARV